METAKIVFVACLAVAQTMGYSSTIVHLPEQKSASTVQFNFPQQHSVRSSRKQVDPNIFSSSYPENDAQPQLFNVGYSVRFESQQSPTDFKRATPRTQFVKAKLNDGEIITGTRKQNVQVDIPSNNNQESQTQAHKIVPKRKFIGQKTSQVAQTSRDAFVSSQANLLPATQQQLEVLGNAKDLDYQQDLSDLYQKKYTWQNLSPNVKIIKSTEIPLPSESIENRALVFDHAKALSKSEGFGFSDAIRDEGEENPGINQLLQHKNEQRLNTAPPTQNFRVVEVSDQINQPSATQLFKVQGIYPSEDTVHQETPDVTQKIQYKPTGAPKVVQLNQLKPANIFQILDNSALKPQQTNQDIITQPVQKQQVIIQHMKLPISHADSTKKFPVKFKYIKQIPGRGALPYGRKVIPNYEFTRKARIKPELRRNFVLPRQEY